MAGKQSASAPAASELRQEVQLILDRLQAAETTMRGAGYVSGAISWLAIRISCAWQDT